MTPRQPKIPLLLGLVSSIAIHVGLLIPVLMMAMTVRERPSLAQARFKPKQVAPPEEPEEEEPEIQLGVESEEDRTSLTWIGYDEYKEHMAQLGEVDQSAFTTEPTAGAPPAPPVENVPPVEPDQAPAPDGEQQPVEESPMERDDPEQAAAAEVEAETEDVPTAPDPAEAEIAAPEVLVNVDELREMEVPAKDVAAAEMPDEAQSPEAPPADEATDEVVAELLAALREQWLMPAPVTAADAPTKQTDGQREQPAVPPQPARPPQPEQRPGPKPVADQQADVADKESDAFSTTEFELEEYKPGQTLAASGLELKPSKPNFTAHTRLTANPRDPVVLIQFGRNGRVTHARLIKKTGDSRVDGDIRSSLYNWTAKGKQLATLGPKDSIEVRIKFILRRR